MRFLSIHAHFDDYEFTASGTFEMLRRQNGADFRGKIIVCTDGAAGHHFRTRRETAEIRWKEQVRSSEMGQFELQLLRLPNHEFVPEGFVISRPFLAALWKAIRDFKPDYIFCPPIPSDPALGVHTDHWSVAEAVRRIAYLINVPHAFTDVYPADETYSTPIQTPVILWVYDGYMMGGNRPDIAIDVEDAFDVIAATSYCHQSQLCEWLPWIGRHTIKAPTDLTSWSQILRERIQRQCKDLGVSEGRALEFFSVTAWGELPSVQKLQNDFPSLNSTASNLDGLTRKLSNWGVL